MLNLELMLKGDKYFEYEDLTNYLPKDDLRFIIYDLDYETQENPPRKTSKIIFIRWQPVTAPFKRRFVCGAIADKIKNAFAGIQKEIFAYDLSELERDYIVKELLKN